METVAATKSPLAVIVVLSVFEATRTSSLAAFPPSVLAFVAFVALVALVAFVAFVALVAESAAAAAGTFASPDSKMSAPVSESSLTLAPVIAFAPILAFVAEPLLILAAVTALFFSCFVPTLFFGSAVAAYVVPPSAMNSARSASVFPRRKRRNPLVIFVLPFSCDEPVDGAGRFCPGHRTAPGREFFPGYPEFVSQLTPRQELEPDFRDYEPIHPEPGWKSVARKI